jgi:hypothetical protein
MAWDGAYNGASAKREQASTSPGYCCCHARAAGSDTSYWLRWHGPTRFAGCSAYIERAAHQPGALCGDRSARSVASPHKKGPYGQPADGRRESVASACRWRRERPRRRTVRASKRSVGWPAQSGDLGAGRVVPATQRAEASRAVVAGTHARAPLASARCGGGGCGGRSLLCGPHPLDQRGSLPSGSVFCARRRGAGRGVAAPAWRWFRCSLNSHPGWNGVRAEGRTVWKAGSRCCNG